MDKDERFEILKTELSLIQATLDKYDDLIFRGRNLFITLWLACLGLSFTIKSTVVPLLAIALSFVYWFLEGMMRHQYWHKYVERYRFLRSNLNNPDFNIEDVSIYDLTNHYHREEVSAWTRIRSTFLKVEPSALYGIMGVSALTVWYLLERGILRFPSGS